MWTTRRTKATEGRVGAWEEQVKWGDGGRGRRTAGGAEGGGGSSGTGGNSGSSGASSERAVEGTAGGGHEGHGEDRGGPRGEESGLRGRAGSVGERGSERREVVQRRGETAGSWEGRRVGSGEEQAQWGRGAVSAGRGGEWCGGRGNYFWEWGGDCELLGAEESGRGVTRSRHAQDRGGTRGEGKHSQPNPIPSPRDLHYSGVSYT